MSWLRGLSGVVVGIVLASLVTGLLIGGSITGVGLVVKAGSDHWNSLATNLNIPALPQRSVLVDKSGKVFARLWEENRQEVSLDQIAPVMRAAVISVEDARFYENNGVDTKGTLRALASDIQHKQVQGGSTITQQYVKNVLALTATTPQARAEATAPTVSRKIQEARYAFALNQTMTKDQILQGYLNTVYFGAGAYGVEAAAERYFSVSAKDLTLPQAAMIAGMVQSPTAYDPIHHPEAATQRRSEVLDRMAATGSATQADVDAAKKAALGLKLDEGGSGCVTSTYPVYCDAVVGELAGDARFGSTPSERVAFLKRGGLTVKTGLDPAVADQAQRAVDAAKGSRAALASVSVDPPTGEVREMVDSVAYGQGPGQSVVNYAAGGSSGFPAGSTFKMFVLLAALEKGIPRSMTLNAPAAVAVPEFAKYNNNQPYVVHNASDSEAGNFTLEEATWKSVNTYYIQLEAQTGLERPAAIAESLGVRQQNGSALPRIPSLTLGTIEVSPEAMAGAYAGVDNHGNFCSVHTITGIVQSGKVILDNAPHCTQVIDRGVADTATDILRGVIDQGTGKNGKLDNVDEAGKTGTVENSAAAWFVGFTPSLSTAVWMGDPRGGFSYPLTRISVGGRYYAEMFGGDVPCMTWRNIMQGQSGSFDLQGVQ